TPPFLSAPLRRFSACGKSRRTRESSLRSYGFCSCWGSGGRNSCSQNSQAEESVTFLAGIQ
ncbi:uncharacterized, partial [Tachysurus ichikawai]